MRARRPALYSDSLLNSSAPLSRAEFEYRLQTITARSEEAQFQRFVHALLEAEVCPNLLPQTGPTGGGDSKVDTETYAVADAIAERWWSGTAREASGEQWAFAISAMKDWRKKARKDIANVLASGRIYQRIYFVTNQFVRDKDRAKIETELTRQAGNIPVRIFDRTWILQAVFDHERWPIAERELGLQGARTKSPGAIGPLDANRARQLAQVEAEIKDPARFAQSPLQLAHAWLTSALLARGLGRTREEVDQRFDRAIEAAQRSGNTRSQRRMLYQKAWTAFWWYDDSASMLGGYDAIEALLDAEVNAWDLEELTNLITLLHTAETNSLLPPGTSALEARRDRLRGRLTPLANRRAYPTDAAWARTHLLQLNFLTDPENPQQHRETIKGFQALLREIERLPEYPVESLCEVISVFTQLPFTIEGIDEVADRAGELIGRRAGAHAQARQLLDRAAHKVGQQASEDALRLLGRTWAQLHRQPSRDLFLEGTWVAAQAYSDVGLFCAARAHLLLGLNRSLRTIVEDAEVSGDTLSFAVRLAWVELAAGRLTLMLNALRMADDTAMALDLPEREMTAYLSVREDLEVLLARAIAASSREDAEAIRLVPTLLAKQQLPLAEQVSLALLGHPQDALLAMTEDVDLAAIQAIPLPSDIGSIQWNSGDSITIRSRILGCELVANGVATHEARSLLMALFAALEGFAATGFSDRMTPVNDHLMFSIDDSLREPTVSVHVEEDDCGDPTIRVCFARGTLSAYATTDEFRDKAIHGVISIIGHVFWPGSRADLERMFAQDSVQDRSFGLLAACALDDTSAKSPTLEGLLQSDAVLTDLVSDGRFPPLATPDPRPLVWGAQVPGSEQPRLNPQFHHRHTRLVGVINIPLWDRAQWLGVAFVQWSDGVPGVSLFFKDADAAAKIMRGLHRRVGSGDADQIVRLAILTDIDKRHRAHYRVGIAPAAAGTIGDATKTIMIALRINTMTPDQSTNLDAFLTAFAEQGRFRLDVSSVTRDLEFPPTSIAVAPIEFQQLDVKAAWQIESHQPPFGMMIRSDDQPFIPEDVERPTELPVLQLIRVRKQK